MRLRSEKACPMGSQYKDSNQTALPCNLVGIFIDCRFWILDLYVHYVGLSGIVCVGSKWNSLGFLCPGLFINIWCYLFFWLLIMSFSEVHEKNCISTEPVNMYIMKRLLKVCKRLHPFCCIHLLSISHPGNNNVSLHWHFT